MPKPSKPRRAKSSHFLQEFPILKVRQELIVLLQDYPLVSKFSYWFLIDLLQNWSIIFVGYSDSSTVGMSDIKD